MSVRCNTGKPETSDPFVGPGESVHSGEVMTAVGDGAGASEPSEDALKFILVAGSGGDHHHPAENGMLPLPSGSGVVFLGVLRRQLAFGGPETVNRNQVRMKCVWRLLPDALGRWHGHRPRSDAAVESPVAALLRGGSDIAEPFGALPGKPMLAGLRRWTSASSPAKSLLRMQRTLLVFSQVLA
jgi:hypothetical protein